MKIAAWMAAAALVPAGVARGAEPGEEVEVTSGVVTGLSCALRAREGGELRHLTACPPAEAARELVIFDVAERRIYRISWKKVYRWQLESAFGGGSIDFTGRSVSVDSEKDIATVDVADYSVARKPKAGAFKGCL